MIWERRSEQPLFWVGLIDHLKVKLVGIAAAEGELTEVRDGITPQCIVIVYFFSLYDSNTNLQIVK